MLAGDKTTGGMTDILPLPLLSPPIAGFVLPGNGLEPRRHSTYTTIILLRTKVISLFVVLVQWQYSHCYQNVMIKVLEEEPHHVSLKQTEYWQI